MLLVDSYAQNYRWSMLEILNMTMPQIYMLNGGAMLNRQRLDQRVGKGHAVRTPKGPVPSEIVWNGKTLEQLNSDEYMAYVRAGQSG